MRRIVMFLAYVFALALFVFVGPQEAQATGYVKLANPANLPTGNAWGAALSSDGTYLAVAYYASPYLIIYKRSGDTFSQLSSQPDTAPTGNGDSAAFSPDDTYLAIGHATSPYLTIYKRSGDTFTKLTSQPDTLPAGETAGVAFSADGTYLAAAYLASPYLTIYKRSGDTFTKLTSQPDTAPAGNGNGVTFSSDGTYLAVGHNTSPYLTIYKRSGDTFTKLTSQPDTAPGGTGMNVAFNSDNTHLVIAHATTSPYVVIYKRSGDTFTKLTSQPDTALSGNGAGAAFTPDDNNLVLAHSITPFSDMYYHNGDTFTKTSQPPDLPAGDSRFVAFSSDGNYMAIPHATSPYISIYKVSSIPVDATWGNNAGGGTTLVINKPVGLTTNDVMVANITVVGGTGITITPPANWNLVRRTDSGTALAHATYWKAATGSEPSSYTWTITSAKASGGIMAYRGIDTASPIDAENGQANASSVNILAPTITTTVANTVLVFGGGTATGTTVSSYPSGLSKRFSDASTGGGAGSRSTTTGGDELKASTGSTGTRTVVMAAAAVNIGHLLALKPAAGSGPTDDGKVYLNDASLRDAYFKQ